MLIDIRGKSFELRNHFLFWVCLIYRRKRKRELILERQMCYRKNKNEKINCPIVKKNGDMAYWIYPVNLFLLKRTNENLDKL